MTGRADDLHTIDEIVAALQTPARAEELEGGEELVVAMAAAVVAHDQEAPAPMSARSRSLKLGLLAGAAVLSIAGAAAAATAVLPAARPTAPVVATSVVVDDASTSTTPDAATTTGPTTSAADAAPPSVPQAATAGDAVIDANVETDGGDTDGAAGTVTAPPCPEGTTSHGQYVSDVARNTPPGPAHGKIVAAAAQSDCGKEVGPASTGSASTTADDAPGRSGEHGNGNGNGNGGSSQGNGNGQGNGKGQGTGQGNQGRQGPPASTGKPRG